MPLHLEPSCSDRSRKSLPRVSSSKHLLLQLRCQQRQWKALTSGNSVACCLIPWIRPGGFGFGRDSNICTWARVSFKAQESVFSRHGGGLTFDAASWAIEPALDYLNGFPAVVMAPLRTVESFIVLWLQLGCFRRLNILLSCSMLD